MEVREFLQQQKTARPRARQALETIRDHIDCSSPYLHELIAFLARMDRDEPAKTQAVERLKDFGPQFADWEARWDTNRSPKTMIQSLATAVFGLAKSFDIEIKS